jgi:hypothetical protein
VSWARWSRTESPTQSQLRLSLEAPARARNGEPVPLVFTVTNAGGTPLTLHLLGRAPSADFRILDSRGRLIWSRLRGQTLLGALQLFALDAGRILSFQESWNQRTDAGRLVAPGEYLIRGVLLTDHPEGLASPPGRLLIEP